MCQCSLYGNAVCNVIAITIAKDRYAYTNFSLYAIQDSVCGSGYETAVQKLLHRSVSKRESQRLVGATRGVP